MAHAMQPLADGLKTGAEAEGPTGLFQLFEQPFQIIE